MHTDAYKGVGWSDHEQKNAFVRRLIENATVSEPFKPLSLPLALPLKEDQCPTYHD